MSPDWREQHFSPKTQPAQKPKRRIWPFLLLLAAVGMGSAGYYFRDYLMSLFPKSGGPTGEDSTPTITQARANELQRLIESRERGLDLLNRDHARVAAAFTSAEAAYNSAKSRLAALDASKPAPSSNDAFYRWSVERNNAASAISTAAAELKRQKSLNDSFLRRIEKATQERDEAKRILDTHAVESAN